MSIIFEGKEYYTSKWKNLHPGWSRLIESAMGCDVLVNQTGPMDITELYKSYHSTNLFNLLPSNPKHQVHRSYYIFSDKYKKIQNEIYSKRIESCDKYDIIMWSSFFLYLLDLNCILSGILLIILGGYGHQYVHTSSNKASMLTIVGFISNQWRYEHVFSHHPYTNTDDDIDLTSFMNVNKIHIPSILRFLIVSIVIVLRPFIHCFIPKYMQIYVDGSYLYYI